MKVTVRAVLPDQLVREAKFIGERFARLRAARGVKQEEAAIRAGLSRSTASRLELGDPGVAVGQLLRYLDAIAPGAKLQELLAADEPSLQILASREKTRRVRDLSSKELAELDF